MKRIKFISAFFAIFLVGVSGLCQGSFSFSTGISQEKIPIEIINHLVVIPVTVNGTALKFLLDTGASGTIIFRVEENQNLYANNATYIDIKGAGVGKPIKAIKSSGNTIRVGQTTSYNEEMYVIIDEKHNFSPQLGIDIQGIIGYEFFKDFIVEIDYLKEKLSINSSKSYSYSKCKKCETHELSFSNKRPYINAEVTSDNATIVTKMLLDSGASDALWLFTDSHADIKIPERNFIDFLGVGLNGNIQGKRAYTKTLKVGKTVFQNVTTAFPDSTSIKNITNNKLRNGSIGAGFLHRFNCIIDYPNKKITLRKNRNFEKPFNYNKSGLTVQHGDYTIEKELLSSNDQNISRANEYTTQVVNLFKSHNNYRNKLVATYEVAEVRANSVAAKAGIQKGDLILSINNKNTKRMNLEDINNYFFQEDGKQINIKLERNGIEYRASFVLKSIL